MPLPQNKIKHEIYLRTPIKMRNCAFIISKDTDYAIFYRKIKDGYRAFVMVEANDFVQVWNYHSAYYDPETECLIDVD